MTTTTSHPDHHLLARARRMQARYAAKGWEITPRAVAGTLRIDPALACLVINALQQEARDRDAH